MTLDERTIKRIIDSPPRWMKDLFKSGAVLWCRVFKARGRFVLDGRSFSYFYHPYNLAWRNERAVEVPIAMSYLAAHKGQSVLEVGNVLSHYFRTDHDVLDKYERAPGVINEDAATYATDKKYDLIISISTLEHVGWDEREHDPEKALAAIENLSGSLAAGGEFLITAPVGLNPHFDRLLESGSIPFDELWALKRGPRGNRWEQEDPGSVFGTRYPRSSFRAGAIAVGLIRK
jgi:hypothetical protein